VNRIYVALPTYDGSRSNTGAILDLQASLGDRAILHECSSSLLTYNFNGEWAEALNRREEFGLSHFLLLHADVLPLDPNWITLLLSEMTRVDAQVLSLVLPIKSADGLTSTALDTDPWYPRRLTLAEVMALPVTFTHEKLLVNTGCLLVRFDEPWVERICFQTRDAIRRGTDGKFQAVVEPEDWNFSRQCHSLGVRMFATRVVKAIHQGTNGYRNDVVWGKSIDQDHLDLQTLPTMP
jgi:hypothetical protein